MANKFKYQSQIQQGLAIQSWHVSQSTDAFTGAQDYDILISGSLTLTGSYFIEPNNLITNTQPYILSYNNTTGQILKMPTSSIFDPTSTGSLLLTASVNLNTITFTKADGSTFPIIIDTGSIFEQIYERGLGSNSIQPITGNNNASGTNSIIGGGCDNLISFAGIYSIIGGGCDNSVCNLYSSVLGGFNNSAVQIYSTIGGGQNNCAVGISSFIGGGNSNNINVLSNYTSIVGGQCNIVADCGNSFIGGGDNNCSAAGAKYSVIGGGEGNTISGYYSSILGGDSNTVTSEGSIIAGGCLNIACGCKNDVIVGGCNNKILANSCFGFIGSGCNNTIFGSSGRQGQVILGGHGNRNNHNSAFIVGSNITSSKDCTTFVNCLSIEDGGFTMDDSPVVGYVLTTDANGNGTWQPNTQADTGSLLTTASVNLNEITFTKGDGSTFPILVDTGSFTQVDTGSLLTTASVNLNEITFTKGDSSTFTLDVNNTLQQITDNGSVTTNDIKVEVTGGFPVTTNYTEIKTGSIVIKVDDGLFESFTRLTGTIPGFGNASNTILFPNNNGTVALVSDIPSDSSYISTASVNLNEITFTKGDGSTFPILVDTGSFIQVNTGSFYISSSVNLNTITFNQGDGTTETVTIDTGSFTPVNTGSLLTTASVSLNEITFTKGDSSTFSITVNTGSAGSPINTGSLLVTSSYSNGSIEFEKGDNSTYSIIINSGSFSGSFEGDGSGLNNVDAETLDSLNSTQFLRSDTDDSKTSGNTTYDDGTQLRIGSVGQGTTDFGLKLQGTAATTFFDLSSNDISIRDAEDSFASKITINRSTGNITTVGKIQPDYISFSNNVITPSTSAEAIYSTGGSIYIQSGQNIELRADENQAGAGNINFHSSGSQLASFFGPNASSNIGGVGLQVIDGYGKFDTIILANSEPTALSTAGQIAYDENDTGTTIDYGNYNGTSPIGMFVHDSTDVRRIWTSDNFGPTQINNWQDVYNAWGGETPSEYVTKTGTPANNQLAIFTDSNTVEGDSNLTWDGDKLSIISTTTSEDILITTNEDSSTASPIITLRRNSLSPSDGDYLGQFKFNGENDGGGEVIYAKITAKISDATANIEDGLIETAVKLNGVNNIVSRQTGDTLKLINGVGLEVAGDATISTINNATTDTDKFLVSDGGIVKYRTGAEVLSDIGAASTADLTNYVTLNTSQTITAEKTFDAAQTFSDEILYTNLPASNGVLRHDNTGLIESVNGTSDQFVKGDGTLDSNTYLTSSTSIMYEEGLCEGSIQPVSNANEANNCFSNVGGGCRNTINTEGSYIGGGICNTINDTGTIGNYSSIIGGCNNTIANCQFNTHVIGSNITAGSSNTTFVNNLTITGSLNAATVGGILKLHEWQTTPSLSPGMIFISGSAKGNSIYFSNNGTDLFELDMTLVV